MNTKEKIIELNGLRYDLIHERNNIENITNEEEVKFDDQIDMYAKEIETLINENINSLEFDFIFEQLSNLGQAPNLLYDDNGNWAVTSTGYQNVVWGDEPEDVETHFFIEAKFWKPTPREALQFYLTYEEDDDE